MYLFKSKFEWVHIFSLIQKIVIHYPYFFILSTTVENNSSYGLYITKLLHQSHLKLNSAKIKDFGQCGYNLSIIFKGDGACLFIIENFSNAIFVLF